MKLKEIIKKELRILSEQWTGPTPPNAGGFRVCKCSQVDANGTCDTWGLNHLGDADYHFTQWNAFWQIDGQMPQVGDIISAFGVDRYVDRVNPTPDINCYSINGSIGVPCNPPNYYNGEPAQNWSSQSNPDPSCPGAAAQCDTTTASACAQQWFPSNPWAVSFMASNDCTSYSWYANNLEQDAIDIMALAPNPQPGPYNDWNDIKNAANASGLGQPQKGQFKRKMAKGKYSQCQMQACNC